MATFTVTNLNDSGAGSLRQAIIDANATADADTIEFAAGITGGSTAGVDDGVITLSTGELGIFQDITINGDTTGDGKADITISGNDASRIFHVVSTTADVTLRSLDITNGFETGGGGAIHSLVGTMSIVNSTVRDSTAQNARGGAIEAKDLTMHNSAILNNTAGIGGGVSVREGTGTFVNVTISGNTATDAGGGIHVNNLGGTLVTVILKQTTLTGNSADINGGGIRVDAGGILDISNSIVSGNMAPANVNVYETSGNANITAANSLLGSGISLDTDSGSNFQNVDSPGLAALADNGGATQTHALLPGSVAISSGLVTGLGNDILDIDGDGDTAEVIDQDANGGARVQNLLDIGAVEYTTVVDTLSDVDDGNYSAGNLSLREAVGLVEAGGTIRFSDAITGGNTATDNGVITLAGTQIALTSDVKINGDTDGDGIADITLDANNTSRVIDVTSGADVTLESLTLANGNVGGDTGGGLRTFGGGDLLIINTTIRDSTAETGGGLYLDGSSFNAVNSTFTGNTAQDTNGGQFSGDGGGLFARSGTMNLVNTTVSGNTAAGAGVGIDKDAGSTFTVLNSTFADDINVGGMGSFLLQNSIVAGAVTGTLAGGSANNLVVADAAAAGLLALADNGGPVQTHQLAAGSAAIGAGDATLLFSDAFDLDGDGDTNEPLSQDAIGGARTTGANDVLNLGAVQLGNDDFGVTAALASVVTVGGSATGNSEVTTDADWFAVEFVSGTTYRIQQAGSPTGNGTNPDPRLQGIFDPSETLIAGTTDGDGGPGFESLVFFTAATSGTHFIEAGSEFGGFGTYTLFVDAVSDDFGVTAATAGAVTVGATATGDIDEPGDEDWFEVSLTAGETYVFSLTPEDGARLPLTEPVLSGVFDSTETLIAGTPDDSPTPTRSTIIFTATETGTHFIAASGDDDGDVGRYTLAASLFADDFSADISTTGTVTVGGTATGDLEVPEDQDWFAVELVSGFTYTIGLKGVPSNLGTLSDPFLLGVLDSTGTLIPDTQNDDSGFGIESQLSFTATTTGTHFIAAAAFGQNAGTYTLSVDDEFVSLRADDENSFIEASFATIALAVAAAEDNDVITVGAGHYTASPETISTALDNLGIVTPAGTSTTFNLIGAGNQDFRSGGAGDFVVQGNGFANYVFTGSGADSIAGGAGNDTLNGRAGADTLDGGDDIDEVSYMFSDALVVVNLNNGAAIGGHAQGDTLIDIENLSGSDFDDRFTGNNLANEIIGRSGNDLIAGLGGNDVLIGSFGQDSLAGGSGDDTLDGGSNDDRLFGNGDNDSIDGGAGDDFTNGGAGDDTINGGENDDNVLVGGSGDDLISGGTGNDGLNGSFDNDTLRGDDGDDRLFGGDGDDNLEGGDDNDILGGLADQDVLFGGQGDDSMNGGGDNDVLNGDAGDDRMFGGTGADTLNGGADDDLLIGQSGIDTYVFDAGWGNDQISSYGDVGTGQPRVDEVIDMSSLSITFADLTVEAFGSGTRIFITADGATDNSIEVLFRGVSQITEADFFFG